MGAICATDPFLAGPVPPAEAIWKIRGAAEIYTAWYHKAKALMIDIFTQHTW